MGDDQWTYDRDAIEEAGLDPDDPAVWDGLIWARIVLREFGQTGR